MRKRPPFVEFFRDRHGKPRLYFRRDRRLPRIRLPGVVGSPEFNRAYEDSLAGRLSKPTLARPARPLARAATPSSPARGRSNISIYSLNDEPSFFGIIISGREARTK